MQGDKSVIGYLNRVLKNELTAINQYFLHARMLQNWGLEKLNDHEYHASIKVMKHADKITQRILFLESLPNLQDLGKLHIGEHVPEVLQCDIDMLNVMLPLLREAIGQCEKSLDFVSRDLLTEILETEEEQLDWLETQQELIQKIGLENYLQSMI
ncbi:MAG: bacterioferritin [Pseudomonadota bacterium]